MMIYEPREDSFLLAKYVKEYAKGRVLDVGCGSGILAKAALEKTKDVEAVDINKRAVAFCKGEGINAYVSDLFQHVKGKFDLIVFNPPYLPRDAKEDRESRRITTGGKHGYELLERFLKNVKDYLNADGKVLIVVSSLTGNVENLLRKQDFFFKRLEEQKLFLEKLVVYLLFI